MSPEALQADTFCSLKSDVYSFGMVIWEMATRLQPFENIPNNEAVKEHVLDGGLESLQRVNDPQIRLLIDSCWQHNRRDRLDIKSLSSEVQVLRQQLHSPPTPEKLPPAEECGRCELEGFLRQGQNKNVSSLIKTLVSLVCDYAKGGAIVVLAPAAEILEEFTKHNIELCESDSGYMTERLAGVRISTSAFRTAFSEFTGYSVDNRWPESHPDARARGQPKDGAWLIDVSPGPTSGMCVKAAAKILGIAPVRSCKGVGTMHEVAQSIAWALEGSIVCVRTDDNKLHFLVRRYSQLTLYHLTSDFKEAVSARTLEKRPPWEKPPRAPSFKDRLDSLSFTLLSTIVGTILLVSAAVIVVIRNANGYMKSGSAKQDALF